MATKRTRERKNREEKEEEKEREREKERRRERERERKREEERKMETEKKCLLLHSGHITACHSRHDSDIHLIHRRLELESDHV